MSPWRERSHTMLRAHWHTLVVVAVAVAVVLLILLLAAQVTQ